MASTDEYKKLRTKDKDRLFTELFALKDAKAELDKRIKEIEKQYKPDLIEHYRKADTTIHTLRKDK